MTRLKRYDRLHRLWTGVVCCSELNNRLFSASIYAIHHQYINSLIHLVALIYAQ